MIPFFSFLVAESPLTSLQSSKAQLLLSIMPIGIVAYTFTLVGQPLSKQLYAQREQSCMSKNHTKHILQDGSGVLLSYEPL